MALKLNVKMLCAANLHQVYPYLTVVTTFIAPLPLQQPSPTLQTIIHTSHM